MATQKQRKAANNLVGNGGNITKAMKDAGYSDATANTPQKLTESKGFLALCDEYGLTDDLILKALVDDIRNKPQDRRAELELAAKLRGRLNTKVEITDPTGVFAASKLTIEFADAPQVEPDAGSGAEPTS